MPILHVLRVFVNEDDEWGNRLGVFLEGDRIRAAARRQLAAELGFSETVFVDDAERGRVQIHTPTTELDFAGHPLVGVAWLLAREGVASAALLPPAGEVGARRSPEGTFIAAPPAWAPSFEYRQLETPTAVRSLSPTSHGRNTYAWSWIDEAAGTVRARCFAREVGIAEDEATGSAALALCAQLGRPISIHQGHGSVILCRLLADGRAEVGGRVVLDEVREVEPGDA